MKYKLASDFSDGISRQQDFSHALSRRRKISVCVAAAVVGFSMMSAQDAQAAGSRKKSKNKATSSNEINELKAENARLREQLEELWAAQKGNGAPAAGAVPPVWGFPAAGNRGDRTRGSGCQGRSRGNQGSGRGGCQCAPHPLPLESIAGCAVFVFDSDRATIEQAAGPGYAVHFTTLRQCQMESG